MFLNALTLLFVSQQYVFRYMTNNYLQLIFTKDIFYNGTLSKNSVCEATAKIHTCSGLVNVFIYVIK